MSVEDDIAAARVKAQEIVGRLNENVRDFADATANQRRLQLVLAGGVPPTTVYRKGQKLDAAPIIARINEQVASLRWAIIVAHKLMPLIKELACDSFPRPSRQQNALSLPTRSS